MPIHDDRTTSPAALSAASALAALLEGPAGPQPHGIVGFHPDGRAVTAAEVVAAADRLAERLPPGGRRVALHAPPTLASVVALHAIWRSGNSAVMVSTTHHAEDLERRAQVAGAAAAITFAVDDDPTTGIVEQRPGPHGEARPAEATVTFTSGTTGAPKGVPISAAALLRTVQGQPKVALPTEGRRATIVFHSLSHVAAPLNIVTSAHLGVPVIIQQRFTVPGLVDLLERFEVPWVRLTPAMLYDLAHWPHPLHLPGLQGVGCGTAELPEPVRQRFEDRYGLPIAHPYASSETLGVAVEDPADVLAGRRRPGSSGRILPGVEVRLLQPDGSESPPGAPGRLAVRSAVVFSGYLTTPAPEGSPEPPSPASSPRTPPHEAVRSDAHPGLGDRPDDGWFLTSDVVRIDDDGYLYVLGRVDDVVVCGGFNIYPSRVEAALRGLPEVADALVTGIDHDRLGQIPVAAVVPTAGDPDGFDVDAVVEQLRRSLPHYEVPRQIVVRRDVPRTAAGKPDRRALRRELDPTGDRPAVAGGAPSTPAGP